MKAAARSPLMARLRLPVALSALILVYAGGVELPRVVQLQAAAAAYDATLAASQGLYPAVSERQVVTLELQRLEAELDGLQATPWPAGQTSLWLLGLLTQQALSVRQLESPADETGTVTATVVATYAQLLGLLDVLGGGGAPLQLTAFAMRREAASAGLVATVAVAPLVVQAAATEPRAKPDSGAKPDPGTQPGARR